MKEKLAVLLTLLILLASMTFSDDVYAAGKKKYIKSLSVANSLSVEQYKEKNIRVKMSVVNKASKDLSIKIKNKNIVYVRYLKDEGILKFTGLKPGKTTVTITTKAKNAKGRSIKKSIKVVVKGKKVVKKLTIKSDVKGFKGMSYATVKNKYGGKAELEGGGRFYVRIPNRKYQLYILDYSNEIKDSDTVSAVVGEFQYLFDNVGTVRNIDELSKALGATSVERQACHGSPYDFSDNWYIIKYKNGGEKYTLNISVSSATSTAIDGSSYAKIGFY